jgi:hypothetical protein
MESEMLKLGQVFRTVQLLLVPSSSSWRLTAQTSIRIEQVFARLKHFLRKAAERAVEAIFSASRRLAGVQSQLPKALREAPLLKQR